MNLANTYLSEQRAHQRKNVHIQCKFIKENIQSKITLVDVSETGLAFVTHEEYRVGQEIEVEFTPEHGQTLQLKIQIKNIASTICANRIGVQLLEIPQAFLEFIQTFFRSAQNKFLKRFQTLPA